MVAAFAARVMKGPASIDRAGDGTTRGANIPSRIQRTAPPQAAAVAEQSTVLGGGAPARRGTMATVNRLERSNDP